MSGDLENLILDTVERWWAGRYSERHGLVTSYDPKTHLAKVTFQPEGQESGWIPIETGHIGNGFGIAIGLTPGDGKKTGDQVVVRYQEGDFESGKIVQRVHSDDDKPPTVQSGEVVLWTRFTKTAKDKSGLSSDTTDDGTGDQVGETGGQQGSGQQIFFKNDGSITFMDGAGSTIVMDGKGNYAVTCQNMTETINKDHSISVSGKRTDSVTGNKTVSVGGDHSDSVGGSKSVSVGKGRTDNVGGSWMANAAGGLWAWLISKGDTTP